MMGWVRSQVRSHQIYGEESDAGAGFILFIQFALSVVIPQTVHVY
jgi:hypothetical protein